MIDTTIVEYGGMPTHTNPTKPATAQYTYVFDRWDKEIAKVTGEATYTAVFREMVNEYTITFVDCDGTELQSGKVAYGETPKYKGTTPTKEPDAQYIYTFKGWSPELKEVAENTTYTAVYSSVKRTYRITWKNDDGSVIDITEVEYGGMPTHTNPTKPATAQYTYVFDRWDKEIAKVTGDATYTATFTEKEKGVYEVVSGAGSTWNEGSSDPLVFTFKRTVDDDHCFDHFTGVLVDNQARTDIDAKRGSTIITISAETLKTLSAGKHTLTVLFDDADPVEVTFTIAAKAAESTTPEKGTNTGDSNHPALWISLMALSLIGIGAVIMFRKKRFD